MSKHVLYLLCIISVGSANCGCAFSISLDLCRPQTHHIYTYADRSSVPAGQWVHTNRSRATWDLSASLAGLSTDCDLCCQNYLGTIKFFSSLVSPIQPQWVNKIFYIASFRDPPVNSSTCSIYRLGIVWSLDTTLLMLNKQAHMTWAHIVEPAKPHAAMSLQKPNKPSASEATGHSGFHGFAEKNQVEVAQACPGVMHVRAAYLRFWAKH